MDHVSAVMGQSVRVECGQPNLRKALLEAGALESGGMVELPYASEAELGKVLSFLQQLNVPFADEPAGWPPAAVFAHLREKGLVRGQISSLTWSGPGQAILREAQ